MKIELFRSAVTRQHYFRIRARNGRIVAQSEGYKRKASAEKTIGVLKAQIPGAKIVCR